LKQNNIKMTTVKKTLLDDIDESAYDITKEKGQIGAMLFCEEMIQDKQRQINEMTFYDGDRISALQDSMMYWGAVRSRVEKGFS
jgi:hypothetical protein